MVACTGLRTTGSAAAAGASLVSGRRITGSDVWAFEAVSRSGAGANTGNWAPP